MSIIEVNIMFKIFVFYLVCVKISPDRDEIMEVTDKIMYHFTSDFCYPEMWEVGKEIIVDDSFNSKFCSILDVFSTGMDVNNKTAVVSYDIIIRQYMEKNKDELSKELLLSLLDDAECMIRKINILNRERALEECRKDNFPHLISRLHSVWLIDESSIDFWKKYFSKRKLLKVSVTGELFKSSDAFIPDDELNMKEMYEEAKKYWKPVFNNLKEEEKSEYLFQGKIKILEEID